MASTRRFADLPSKSKAYIAVIVAIGAMTVTHAVYGLVSQDTGWRWLVLALLTFLSGSATLKLPALPATISVSETFVFTSVLLFGPSAGTLTVALDAFVISCWSYKRGDPFFKITFNLFALPLTIWTASHIFFALPGVEPLFRNTHVQISALFLPLALLATLYFLLNSWIITFAIALESGKRPFPLWREHFTVLSLNYFGGASVAFLLVGYSRDLDFKYVLLIAPLLLVLYLTFRWQIGRAVDANRHLSELNNLYMSTIETLAMAIDAKDQITHGHIRRVQTYAVGLADQMGIKETTLIRAIEAAALLHDMGKLAVPEYILNKPGPLTPAEFEKMKLHSSVGADILSAIDFPYPVVPIVRHHHENWDGSGYPDGLKGADIPIGARILSVVDCFDALTSDRPYRPRLPDKEAIQILQKRRGNMYDPDVVDTFLRVHEEIAPRAVATAAAPLRTISTLSRNLTDKPATLKPLDDISASTEEMLTLFDLARGLNSQMSLQDASDVISKHIRRLVPSSLVVFFLYDADSDELTAAHASGEHAEFLSELRIGVGERLSGWVAAHRRCIRNSDPVLDFGDSARAMSPRLRSCLSVPLMTTGDLVGVLSLYSTFADAFSEDHQRVVEVVSKQVSTILKNATAFDRTRRQVFRDQLTGLPNIEHLYELAKAAAAAESPNEPLSLVILDVDRLAAVNRTLGQHAGDQILDRIVRATRRTLRSADFLFRYRDDEFIVLLLQTDHDTCSSIARRIGESLKRESLVSNPSFSVSIAQATSPRDALDVEELIRIAGSRLKQNRVPGGREAGTDAVH